MIDFNRIYDRYKQASDNKEKLRLIEELKTGLFFNYKDFFDADLNTAIQFFCADCLDLEDLIENFQTGEKTFLTCLQEVLNEKFACFVNEKGKL